MPTWYDLLKNFSFDLKLKRDFGYYDAKSDGSLPQLATLLAEEFNDYWWENDEYISHRNMYKEKRVKSIEMPFKIELTEYIKQFEEINPIYSEEIALLKKAVIDGIITTNWDGLLEKIYPDYRSYVGQEELLFSENISIGEIYKIHGCITNPESIIVTANDYVDFRKKNAYLAAKLLTIFVEHPVIFLGYSISDPNIADLLFSLKDCLSNSNIEKLKDRLIFVEWDNNQTEPILTDGTLCLADGKILPIKHIKSNTFVPILDVLANLKQRLPIKVLRKFKDAVYEFIKTNEPTDKIYVGDLSAIRENTDDVEFVVGVGVASHFAEQGLLGIGIEDIIEDIIFNNKHIPPKEFIKKALPKLLKAKVRAFIPLYKYFRFENMLNEEGGLIRRSQESSINAYFKDKKQESFYPKPNSYRKKLFDIREKYQSLQELINDNDEKHCFYYIPLLECNKIDMNILHTFIVQCFKPEYISNSYFKQLVCYYDFLKYGLNKD
jgi:hypothetical protein